jgi:preprotein translocase subunit SecA
MLNPLNLLSKFIKSSNQRELDKLEIIVNKVNNLEENISNLKDEEFPKKTFKVGKI